MELIYYVNYYISKIKMKDKYKNECVLKYDCKRCKGYEKCNDYVPKLAGTDIIKDMKKRGLVGFLSERLNIK